MIFSPFSFKIYKHVTDKSDYFFGFLKHKHRVMSLETKIASSRKQRAEQINVLHSQVIFSLDTRNQHLEIVYLLVL